MARDPSLITKILRGYLQVLSAWQRRKARNAGIKDPRCGAVTFVQRFGGFLNLNVHFHAVLPDGVFTMDDVGQPRFRKLDPPSNEEVVALTEKVIRRIARILSSHQEHHPDQVGDALGYVQAASIRTNISASRTANENHCDVRMTERSAFIAGFSLHANVSIHQNDREGIERLCRYGLRPAFALDRITWTDDGKIRYQYKRPAPNGKRETICEPVEFLAKLAALIPPPRKHLTRYHGAFAPNHAWRSRIVPTAPDEIVSGDSEVPVDVVEPKKPGPASELARRLDWATLLMRVFAIDVLSCPKCQGRMRALALISDPDAVERILTHLDLPTTPPRASRGPPPAWRVAG